jgi:ABC-type dipeptide/oligopeptide/nickel transport system permease component
MINFILRRLLSLIPVLLCVSFLVCALEELTPGDPVVIMLGQRATPERVAQLREALGLNDPFLVRYGRFVWNALHGDLGTSIRGGTPVLDEIKARLPSTLQLASGAVLFAALLGIPIGILAAKNKDTWIDNFVMVFSMAGLSTPVFWLAIVLIMIFGLQLKWVSVTQGSGLKDLILPSITLGLAPMAALARLTRSSVLEVIGEDYIRTAVGKGLDDLKIYSRHVLRNALIPIVTYMGLLFADLLNGAVFTESVFVRPGLGRFAVNAVAARDFPQIQGLVLFIATFYLLMNLLVDILYGIIDPRVRLS